MVEERIQVDFNHFVKLAKSRVISWESLSTLLDEMASTLALSKNLNKVLIEELKLSETKLHEILSNEKENQNVVDLQNESEQNKTSNLEIENMERGNGVNLETENEMSNVIHEEESENGQNMNKIVQFKQIYKSEPEVEIVNEDNHSKKDFEC